MQFLVLTMQVGYVTYKWPQWLTQQTQQQRIIWGYKILFLDVLFPLNVKKVGTASNCIPHVVLALLQSLVSVCLFRWL